jgi:glycosyltransferase involved in cell wall biosynthesis
MAVLAKGGQAMSSKPIVFLSSHHGVGASESLWLETAAHLAQQGVPVKAGVTWASWNADRLAPLTRAGVKALHFKQTSLIRRFQRKLSPGHDFEKAALSKLGDAALVIVSQGNDHSALPWLEACSKLGLKAAVVTHGIVPSDWPNDQLGARLRVVFPALAASYWVSERNQKDFENQIGTRLTQGRLVWNPIKVPRDVSVPWPTVSDVWSMACVARLQTRPKGHDLLLQSLALPHWHKRALHLSFFGTGENRKGLEHLASLLGISERVHFKGHVEGVHEIWRDHHLIAQPSRHEGMPLSLVEALMCGRPALVTDVAGHAELVTDGENGFLAEAASVRHIDEALQRAWDQRESWSIMGVQAARRIRLQAPVDPISDFAKELLDLARS